MLTRDSALHPQEHGTAWSPGCRVDVQALGAHPAGGVGALQEPVGIGERGGDLAGCAGMCCTSPRAHRCSARNPNIPIKQG
jgi:hypothetical protein